MLHAAEDCVSTHPVDVLLESRGDLSLFLSDHPLQGVQLLQSELHRPSPAAQEGLPGPLQRLPLHTHSLRTADGFCNCRHTCEAAGLSVIYQNIQQQQQRQELIFKGYLYQLFTLQCVYRCSGVLLHVLSPLRLQRKLHVI